jgi:hypothetical protein
VCKVEVYGCLRRRVIYNRANNGRLGRAGLMRHGPEGSLASGRSKCSCHVDNWLPRSLVSHVCDSASVSTKPIIHTLHTSKEKSNSIALSRCNVRAFFCFCWLLPAHARLAERCSRCATVFDPAACGRVHLVWCKVPAANPDMPQQQLKSGAVYHYVVICRLCDAYSSVSGAPNPN